MRADAAADGNNQLELVEGVVLGGGAFSRVSTVVEESHGRQYAMKRMRKTAVVQCPEHVFCEQVITRNTAHPFCIRQVRVLVALLSRFCSVLVAFLTRSCRVLARSCRVPVALLSRFWHVLRTRLVLIVGVQKQVNLPGIGLSESACICGRLGSFLLRAADLEMCIGVRDVLQLRCCKDQAESGGAPGCGCQQLVMCIF